MPPHSSDQTQPLDIGFFVAQMAKMNRMSVPEGLYKQSVQLIKIIDSFRQSSTISNVIASFRGAGIVSSYTTEYELIPRVDRSQAFRVRPWAQCKV